MAPKIMGTEVRLQELTLLARGGQSDIYAQGEGRVLRVARRPQDHDRIRYEYRVYAYLCERNAAVPKVYELLDVDGAPSISMERIAGPTLMDRIRRNPLGAWRGARTLARLHLGILRLDAEAPIVDSRDKARFCIRSSVLLDDSQKKAILRVLEDLPGGNRLCHGDFHPGNIIHGDRTDYIIDWSAASFGDVHSDVAHTYLLLRNAPRVPGLSGIMHRIQRGIGKAISTTYLQCMSTELPINRGTFSRWLLVKAAERTYYGLPSEKQRLVEFIGTCLHDSKGPSSLNDCDRYI